MPLYSHSQLETFENCPIKYKFRYIGKIRKPEEQSIEAFVGSCVHTTLQKLYDDLLFRVAADAGLDAADVVWGRTNVEGKRRDAFHAYLDLISKTGGRKK
jgi:RecB family exonuclease